VQVVPIKPTLKPSGFPRLNLKYDKCFQICFKFAFTLNLCRYSKATLFAQMLGANIRRGVTKAGGLTPTLHTHKFPSPLRLQKPSCEAQASCETTESITPQFLNH